jgi:uncharacterized membrane protein
MEALLIAIVGYVGLGLNYVAVLLIATGGVQALVGAGIALARREGVGQQRQVWSSFARWLVLALEFALAADLLRTIIAPSWNDIGQLAAIAAIRTFLSVFLERDIEAATKASIRSTASG